MLKEYEKKANIGTCFGFMLMFVSAFITKSMVFLIPFLGGYALFIWGCRCYAIGKGYHSILGIAGLLNIIGYMILLCLPDKNKKANCQK